MNNALNEQMNRYISGRLTVTVPAKFTNDLMYITASFIEEAGNKRDLVTFKSNGGLFRPGFDSVMVREMRLSIYDANWLIVRYVPAGQPRSRLDVVREDYTLIGWATTADAVRHEYIYNLKYGEQPPPVLYAVWKDNKAFVEEAVVEVNKIVSHNSTVGGFEFKAVTDNSGNTKLTLTLSADDLKSSVLGSVKPTLETAMSFITSNVVNEIQAVVRNNLGFEEYNGNGIVTVPNDEIRVTIADGETDADSVTDLNGLTASAAAPVLSDLITRENGEKGYEYVYWLKVKRNPYIYVGPYYAWIPYVESQVVVTPPVTTPTVTTPTVITPAVVKPVVTPSTPPYVVNVMSPDREVPNGAAVEVVAVAPVEPRSAGVTAGPNIVRVGGVAEGTYLIKGVLRDKDGGRVKVSVPVAVVR